MGRDSDPGGRNLLRRRGGNGELVFTLSRAAASLTVCVSALFHRHGRIAEMIKGHGRRYYPDLRHDNMIGKSDR